MAKGNEQIQFSGENPLEYAQWLYSTYASGEEPEGLAQDPGPAFVREGSGTLADPDFARIHKGHGLAVFVVFASQDFEAEPSHVRAMLADAGVHDFDARVGILHALNQDHLRMTPDVKLVHPRSPQFATAE